SCAPWIAFLNACCWLAVTLPPTAVVPGTDAPAVVFSDSRCSRVVLLNEYTIASSAPFLTPLVQYRPHSRRNARARALRLSWSSPAAGGLIRLYACSV